MPANFIYIHTKFNVLNILIYNTFVVCNSQQVYFSLSTNKESTRPMQKYNSLLRIRTALIGQSVSWTNILTSEYQEGKHSRPI